MIGVVSKEIGRSARLVTSDDRGICAIDRMASGALIDDMSMVNERLALYGANTHVAIALETGDRQYSQSGSGSLV